MRLAGWLLTASLFGSSAATGRSRSTTSWKCSASVDRWPTGASRPASIAASSSGSTWCAPSRPCSARLGPGSGTPGSGWSRRSSRRARSITGSPAPRRHSSLAAEAGLDQVVSDRELRLFERIEGKPLASAKVGEHPDGSPALHRPDLAIIGEELPIAVEVELTPEGAAAPPPADPSLAPRQLGRGGPLLLRSRVRHGGRSSGRSGALAPRSGFESFRRCHGEALPLHLRALLSRPRSRKPVHHGSLRRDPPHQGVRDLDGPRHRHRHRGRVPPARDEAPLDVDPSRSAPGPGRMADRLAARGRLRKRGPVCLGVRLLAAQAGEGARRPGGPRGGREARAAALGALTHLARQSRATSASSETSSRSARTGVASAAGSRSAATAASTGSSSAPPGRARRSPRQRSRSPTSSRGCR